MLGIACVSSRKRKNTVAKRIYKISLSLGMFRKLSLLNVDISLEDKSYDIKQEFYDKIDLIYNITSKYDMKKYDRRLKR